MNKTDSNKPLSPSARLVLQIIYALTEPDDELLAEWGESREKFYAAREQVRTKLGITPQDLNGLTLGPGVTEDMIEPFFCRLWTN